MNQKQLAEILEQKKAVIFDLDGVVINSLKAHLEHTRASCEEKGIRFKRSMKKYLKTKGKKLKRLGSLRNYRLFLSMNSRYSDNYRVLGLEWPADEPMITGYFKEFMNSGSSKIFDGMSGLLDGLRSLGFKLGLVTSNYQDQVLDLLKENGLEFDCIVCYEDVLNHKPKPDGLFKCIHELGVDKEDAVYIGDMTSDGFTAFNANVDFIGVTYGFCTLEAFLDCPHIAIVDSPENLKKVLLYS